MLNTFKPLFTILKQIVLWIFGIFSILIGLFSFSESVPMAVSFLLLGLVFIPKTYQYVASIFRINSLWIRVFLAFIFFVSAGYFTPPAKPQITQIDTAEVQLIPSEDTSPSNVVLNQDVTPTTASEKYLVVSVTDGDTLRVMYEGKSTPVRLIGIDAPETQHPTEPVQCYGTEAKEYLESLVLNKEVELEKDVSETDKYDRLLRYIVLDSQNVNELLVKEGYVFESEYAPDTKYQQTLKDAQMYAKTNGRGLWSPNTCNGNVYTGTYKDSNNVTNQVVSPAVVVEDTKPNTYVAPPPVYTPAVEKPAPTSNYSCSCSKTCGQMSSCEEAYYQLNTCGCSARDGNNDGVPCESICE